MMWALILLFWVLTSGSAWAACPTTSLTFKDGGGNTQTLCFGGAGGAYIPQYQILDSGGQNTLGVNASGQLTIANAFALETGGNLATLAGAVSFSKMNVAQASPWTTNLTQWAGVTLGPPAPYGTSPGFGNVVGVNAAVTNTPAVSPGVSSNWGLGATGAAPPTNAQYMGASSGGVLTGLVTCNQHAYQHITSATDTLLVQGVLAQTVKICGFVAHFSGSAAQSVYLENTASVNANCSSTKTQIAGLFTGNTSNPYVDGFYNPIWGGLSNTNGNGLCLNSSGTGGVDVDLWYTLGS